jgi:hypothetical protein
MPFSYAVNCPTPRYRRLMPRKYNEKYTRELLTEAVANSISIADVLRYLQIPFSGGTHDHLSRRLKQLGIDTSHFKQVAPNREKPCAWRLTPEHVLVARPPGSSRPEARVLCWAYARVGVPYACEACGIEAEWNGKPIVLHVDHVSGGLARQQEGEPSLSLSELPLANPDIRR